VYQKRDLKCKGFKKNYENYFWGITDFFVRSFNEYLKKGDLKGANAYMESVTESQRKATGKSSFDPYKFDGFLRYEEHDKAKIYLHSIQQKDRNSDWEIAEAKLLIVSSRGDSVTYTKNPTENPVLETKNQQGEVTGYIGSEKQVNDQAALRTGLKKMTDILDKYPNRIDARLWFSDYYRSEGNYEAMLSLVKRIFEESSRSKYQWLTMDNQPVADGPDFVMGNLQGQLMRLFEMKSETEEAIVVKIAELMVKYQEKHVYGHNNLGMIHLYNKRYAQALPHLLRANKIAPADDGVMRNLGLTYQRLGKKTEAEKVYNSILKHENPRFHDWARGKLKEL
jgi:tetratricopeptide (TPR) repeat protein